MAQLARIAHEATEKLVDRGFDELYDRSQRAKLVGENSAGAALGGLAGLGCGGPLLLAGAAAAVPVLAPHIAHLGMGVVKAAVAGGALLGAAIESEIKRGRE